MHVVDMLSFYVHAPMFVYIHVTCDIFNFNKNVVKCASSYEISGWMTLNDGKVTLI